MSSSYGARKRPTHDSPLDVLAAAERVAKASGMEIVPAVEIVDAEPILDARGYHRTPQSFGSYHIGREPNNKHKRYPPDPPTVQECIAMLAACDATLHGRRAFAAIMLPWQGALRAFEALAITEADLDSESGRLIIRRGKGGKQATIKPAAWAWPLLDEWRQLRVELAVPAGPILCVIDGPTAGRAWSYSDLNKEMKKVALAAGVKRRISPHQFRHGWAVQAYQDGVPLKTIQAFLRHSNVGITDAYLQGLGIDEVLDQVYNRAMPTIPATAMLALSALKEETT